MLQNDRANGTVTPGCGHVGVRGYGGRGGGHSDNKRKIQQLEQEVWELRSQHLNKCPNMWILSLEEAIQMQDPQSDK